MAKKHSQNLNFQRVSLSYPPRKWKYKVHDNLFTTRFGEIKPSHWTFLSPGDGFRDSVSNYCRLAPMQSPIFSRVDMKTRMFVVPCRKLQPDFEEFVSSSPSDGRQMIHTSIWDMFMAFYSLGLYGFSVPGTLEEFLGVPPVIDNWYNMCNRENSLGNAQTWSYQPIAPSNYQGYNVAFYLAHLAVDSDFTAIGAFDDYLVQTLGLDALKEDQLTNLRHAAQAMQDEKINLLPFIAYHKIYDDWVRDGRFEDDASQRLYDQIRAEAAATYPFITYTETFEVDSDGNYRGILYFLMTERFANYPKDYFNTVGNGEQLGPQLNVGPQRLEIYGSIASSQTAAPGASVYTQMRIGNPSQWTNGATIPANDRVKQYNTMFAVGSGTNSVQAGVGDVWAEVNDADAITPVKLRYQMALQRFLERANVSLGGSQYSDFVFGEYGIRIPEPYLQRSVLVGSSSTPVIVDEVISQADGANDEAASNVGDFVGRGHFRGHSRQIRGHVAEHCIYMCVQWVIPQMYYWQGLRRDLSRLDNLSFPHYLFQGVGQELVKNKELYFGDNPDGDFGYQYRYSFDQMALDEIHGNFRSDLNFWRTGRDMVGVIPPSPSLIRVNPADSNRIFAYTDSRNMPFYCFTRHNFFHKMPLGDVVGDGKIG